MIPGIVLALAMSRTSSSRAPNGSASSRRPSLPPGRHAHHPSVGGSRPAIGFSLTPPPGPAARAAAAGQTRRARYRTVKSRQRRPRRPPAACRPRSATAIGEGNLCPPHSVPGAKAARGQRDPGGAVRTIPAGHTTALAADLGSTVSTERTPCCNAPPAVPGPAATHGTEALRAMR